MSSEPDSEGGRGRIKNLRERGGSEREAHKTLQIPSLHMQLNERKRERQRWSSGPSVEGGRKDKLNIIGRRDVEDLPLPSKNVGSRFHRGNVKTADKTYDIIKQTDKI